MSFLSWLRNRIPATPRRLRLAFRPGLEALEGRNLPSFASPAAYEVYQPLAVAAADVNGDGKPDLITLSKNGNVYEQLNNGNGAFAPAQMVSAFGAASAMTVGDVNGDGKADVVLAISTTDRINVLLGNGQGGFTGVAPSYIYPAGAVPTISGLALAPLHGGSEMDLVAVNALPGILYVARPLYGDPGTFGPAQSYGFPGSLSNPSFPNQVAVGDFNGDGKPDIAVTNSRGTLHQVSVLLNSGSGTFGTAQNYVVGGTATAIAVGDVSGDGKLDIATANANGTVSVLLNTGAGSFAAAQNYAVGGPANSLALADFNHDGRIDIAIAGSTETDVLLNSGSGAFAAYQKVGPAGSSVVAADLNGDGYADLAEVAASGGSIDVLLNKANG